MASPASDAGLEFRRLAPDLLGPVRAFFAIIAGSPDLAFFHPHPMTDEEAQRLCTYAGRDLYYAACAGGSIVGYGMLRGWDEGYAVPSLGIAIAPAARGQGLARPFMLFLHAAARLRGAGAIRLTVYNTNERAVELYRRLGYVFSPKNDQELIGVLEL